MGTKRRRWPRVLAGVFSAIVLLFTGVAGVGAVAYRNLDDNIKSQSFSPLLNPSSKSASFDEGKPLNILLMGSDTREGQGTDSQYGQTTSIDGARSDTAMVLHISADRKHAYAVSIPRDTLVNIPECPNYFGKNFPAQSRVRFNEAFNHGGALCTATTITAITGVPIDHFVVVDFTGFKGVVEALGGVDVCLRQAVNDPLSGLKLPAGTSTVKGEDALAFVRARYTLGDGSDIGRIERQHAFISSAIRKATSMQVLSNPLTAYRVLDQATKSLTTDTDLASLANMQDLALSMSDIKPSDITFVTAPFVYNTDGNTVSLDVAKANVLWQAMKNDTPWPPPATVPAGQTEPLHADPSSISVKVLNGTATSGQAQKVATDLEKAGYVIEGSGGYPTSDVKSTQILYPAGMEDQARTLAYALKTTDVRVDPNGGKTLTVVVGSDYSGVQPVVTAPSPSASPTPIPSTSAAEKEQTTGVSADTVVCS